MISKIDCAIGKRLKNVIKAVSENKWLLVFEGDLICQIGIDHGWERYDDEIRDDLVFDCSLYRRADLIHAGVVDDEWFRKREEERELENRKKQEMDKKRRLEVYEKLKREFDPSE